MKRLPIDNDYLREHLLNMLNIASPTGFTDEITTYVGKELERLGVPPRGDSRDHRGRRWQS